MKLIDFDVVEAAREMWGYILNARVRKRKCFACLRIVCLRLEGGSFEVREGKKLFTKPEVLRGVSPYI